MIRDRLSRLAETGKSMQHSSWLIRYNPIYYEPIRRLIDQHNGGTIEARRAASDALVSRTLRHASRTRYGRPHGTSLRDWPLLQKPTVQARPDDFIRPLSIRIPSATGGSSGFRLLLARSIENSAAEQAFIDALVPEFPKTFAQAKVAVLRGGVVKPVDETEAPFGKETHNGRRLMLSAHHLSKKTVDWYLDCLARYKPDVLFVYPTSLGQFMTLIEPGKAVPHIPVILSSSEMMGARIASHAAELFGARVIDYYGQAERTSFAYSVADGYRFNPLYGKIELLPDDDRSHPEGRVARIIATGLWNTAMPLVRYDTGDLALLPDDIDEQGIDEIELGMRSFPAILGRVTDVLWTPTGRMVPMLNQVSRDGRNVLQVQFVHDKPDHVSVNTVMLPGASDDDLQTVAAAVRLRFPSELRFTVSRVDALERLPNGKIPLIIGSYSAIRPIL